MVCRERQQTCEGHLKLKSVIKEVIAAVQWAPLSHQDAHGDWPETAQAIAELKELLRDTFN